MAAAPMCLSGGYSPAVLGCGHFNLVGGDVAVGGAGAQIPNWNYRLMVVLRGGITILAPTPTQLLSAPHAFLICPGSIVRFRVGPSSRLLHLAFSVTGQRTVRGFTSISSTQQPPPTAVWGCELPLMLPKELVRSAHALVRQVRIEYFRSLGDRLRSDARLATFLAELVAKLDPENQKPPPASDDAPGKIDPLISLVLSHAWRNIDSGLDWSLPTLAALAGVSVRHLHRRMARLNGGTLRARIEDMALSRAISLLRDSPTMRVSEVASACGYHSAGTFIRAFRRCHGVTPGRWSQLHDGALTGSSADTGQHGIPVAKESRTRRRKEQR